MVRKFLIKVKVPEGLGEYQIRDQNNKVILSDFLRLGTEGNKDSYIYFVDEVPSFSVKVYKLVKCEENEIKPETLHKETLLEISNNVKITILDDLMSFKYEYRTINEEFIADTFRLSYEYYESNTEQGNGKVASGAYIFNPRTQNKLKYSNITSARLFRGKNVTVIQIIQDTLRTDLTIINDQPEKGIEIISHLDPVKNFDHGKEIVLLINSKEIDNNNRFFTDANGYYMQERQRDYKPDFEFSTENGIANNYYPITSSIYIDDDKSKLRLTVNTDRPQGATSPISGQIEIMLHRVTIRDDWKGVSECLQEKDPKTGEMIRVTSRHILSYSQPNKGAADQRRELQYDLDRRLQMWFFHSSSDKFGESMVEEKKEDKLTEGEQLVKLYVRSYKENEFIVRLQNQNENMTKVVDMFGSQTGNKELTVLKKLVDGKSLTLENIEELSWTTVHLRSEVKMCKLDEDAKQFKPDDMGDLSRITLRPMEIRTFKINAKLA